MAAAPYVIPGFAADLKRERTHGNPKILRGPEPLDQPIPADSEAAQRLKNAVDDLAANARY
jgi:hypothetical protein